MRGESHTYSWDKQVPGEKASFDAETMKLLARISDLEPQTHKWLMQPPGANILQVNLKAKYSPFVVVDPRQVAIDCYAGEIIPERSMFPWWNHWPVSQQIRSNGRWAVAPDRVSHSSLAHIQSWHPYEESEDGITMLMLNGLTDKAGAALVPLAQSWLSPAVMELASAGFRAEGFDPAQKAFVVARDGAPDTQPLEVRLAATSASPIDNPAFLVRNWGAGGVEVSIDGAPIASSSDVRVGQVHRLEGDDLVVWIRKSSTSPVTVSMRTVAATGGSRR
jgi:hypothetical protein